MFNIKLFMFYINFLSFYYMAIITNLDVILAKRKMSVTELADKVGISIVNLSRIKKGNVKGIRYSTLNAICKTLECQPGDILNYTEEWI